VRLTSLVASVGPDLEEASFVKPFDCSCDDLLEAGDEEWNMTIFVECLESSVKLLHQILLLQDDVFAAELLDCKEHNEVSVDEW